MQRNAQQTVVGADAEPLWRSEELAEFLGVSPVTPAIWRCRGVGPPAVRISRRCVRYEPEQVRAWLAQRTRQLEAVSA